jgi:hypothetical protein
MHLKERIMKPGKDEHGRKVAHFSINGQKYCVLLHTLIALAFIPNPHNYPDVHYKDNDYTNLRASNLKWGTEAESREIGDKRCVELHDTSMQRFAANGRKKRVNQMSIDGKLIATFPTAREAAKQLSIKAPSISACALGYKGCKTAGGYRWEFA